MLGGFREVRHTLHGRRTRADDAHPLATQPRQVAVGVAARVTVVPAAGMKGVAGERLDAGNARQLGTVQRTIRHADEAGAHAVAAVGLDDPARLGLVPAHAVHLGLEAGVVVEPVVAADPLAVGQDLRRVTVLLLRDVAELLQQRQIDVRLDVALRAGVSVPVPRSTEVAAFLDEADVLHAGLPQPRTGQQAAETAADDDHLHSIRQRLPLNRCRIGIVQEVRELARHLDVLGVALRPQPLIALPAILLAQRVRIEPQLLHLFSHRRFLRTSPNQPAARHPASGMRAHIRSCTSRYSSTISMS